METFPAHRRLIRPSGPESGFALCVALRAVEASSGSEPSRFNRGDLAFVDLSVPAAVSVAAGTCLVLTGSRAALAEVFAGPAALPLIRLPRASISVGMLRSTLFALWKTRSALRRSHGHVLAGTLLDLLGDAAKDAVQTSPPEQLQRVRARAALSRSLRDRLSDPELSPATIGAVLGLSAAAVEVLLDGRPFTELLAHLRLHAARRILQSTAGLGVPIADVSRSVGYVRQSDFSTRYSRLFGVTPRDDRTG